MLRIVPRDKASFWTAEEIDLSADLTDWVRLSDTERHFISHVLTFFAASDGIVNKNLSSNFTTEVTAPEAQCFYGFQIAVENIHSKTYSLLIDTYIKDPKEKLHLLHAIKTVPCVQRKANWALKWCNPTNASFAEHLPPSKAFSSPALAAPYSGSKNADSCLASASATNQSVVTKDSTATLHASST